MCTVAELGLDVSLAYDLMLSLSTGIYFALIFCLTEKSFQFKQKLKYSMKQFALVRE